MSGDIGFRTIAILMETLLRKKLEWILSRNCDPIRKAQTRIFEENLAGTANSLILCGAGLLGRRTLGCLRGIGIEPLVWVDNRSCLWNQTIEGLIVMSPEEAIRRHGASSIFVVTVFNPSGLIRQLLSLGGSRVVSYTHLYARYAQACLPYLCMEDVANIAIHSNDIRRAYSVWSDNTSRAEFVAQLEWRQTLDPKCLSEPCSSRETYFPPDLVKVSSEEVFVDCGAFDGDSVRTFLERVNYSCDRVIALEPDSENCRRLVDVVAMFPPEIKQKIDICNVAVGAVRGKVRFAASGSVDSGVAEFGSAEVECVPLDDIVKSVSPTYIKMDIEGAEPEALIGAQRVLQQSRAVWAICLYHKGEHLWELPLFVASLLHGYRLYLRRYAEDCWELVLYAIPNERCLG